MVVPAYSSKLLPQGVREGGKGRILSSLGCSMMLHVHAFYMRPRQRLRDFSYEVGHGFSAKRAEKILLRFNKLSPAFCPASRRAAVPLLGRLKQGISHVSGFSHAKALSGKCLGWISCCFLLKWPESAQGKLLVGVQEGLQRRSGASTRQVLLPSLALGTPQNLKGQSFESLLPDSPPAEARSRSSTPRREWGPPEAPEAKFADAWSHLGLQVLISYTSLHERTALSEKLGLPH